VGLLDKAKDLATKAAEEAQKAAGAAKEKVDDVQSRRKADDLAKQLGYAIVQERTDGTPAGEEIDRLVAEITVIEASLVAGADDTPPTAGEAPS
jgi:flavodoxin